ncbi:MAG: hypothetical protein ACRDNS_02715, partial [Trebonia sp.]
MKSDTAVELPMAPPGPRQGLPQSRLGQIVECDNREVVENDSPVPAHGSGSARLLDRPLSA